MSIQALRTEAGRNPPTTEEAGAFVAHVESLFMPWNIDALVEGFAEDCEVRFGNVQLSGASRAAGFRPGHCPRQAPGSRLCLGRLQATRGQMMP